MGVSLFLDSVLACYLVDSVFHLVHLHVGHHVGNDVGYHVGHQIGKLIEMVLQKVIQCNVIAVQSIL